MISLLAAFAAPSGVYAQDSEPTYPYTKEFIVSGYYSPLPGQLRYVTGSYEGDIRLNGGGVHGADGTRVYEGMIAAPREIPYGTKIEVPGMGVGSVHDRGGAINGKRLDVWMGSGETGMRRALGWGMRSVTVTVYGVTDEVAEHFDVDSLPLAKDVGFLVRTKYFKVDIGYGDRTESVTELQRLLKLTGFYNGVFSGVYDDETFSAVLRFQTENKVIDSSEDSGAGYFGPQTRATFEAYLEKRKDDEPMDAIKHSYTPDAKKLPIPQHAIASVIAPKKEVFIYRGVKKGDKGDEVKKLQEELSRLNFFKGEATGYFGSVTEHALFKFQQYSGIVASEKDSGAGYLGPKTRAALNGIFDERTENKKLIAAATSDYNEKIARTEIDKEKGEVIAYSVDAIGSLRYGDYKKEVQDLQSILKKLGYFDGELTSPYFGDRTRASILAFQKQYGVIASDSDSGAGEFDERTRKALEAIIGG